MCCRIGQPLAGPQELHEVFSKYDTNHSGQIEFNEFLVLFKERLQDLQKTLRFIRMKPAKSQGNEPSVVEACTLFTNSCPTDMCADFTKPGVLLYIQQLYILLA